MTSLLSGRSPHGEGQRLFEVAFIAKSMGPRQEAEQVTGTSRGQSLASGRTAGLVVLAGRPQGNLAAGNLQLLQQHGC